MKTFNNLEECILEIKRLRIQVDALIQIAKENKTSAETTLAWRELQLAKAWLGKLLGDVSKTPSPYIGAKTPDSVPRQDIAQLAPYKFDGSFDMCNSQRNILDDTIEAFEELMYQMSDLIGFFNNSFGEGKNGAEITEINKKRIYYKFNYTNLVKEHLEQAKIWYGFEIANLRTI